VVVKIATIHSEKLMGAAYELGSVSEGQFADIILVKGDHFYKPDELYKVLGVKPFTVSSNFQ
jgi:imidazolonepropionase-like amidohydrolase